MMAETNFRVVNKAVRKKDAMQLLLGKPAYVDDVTPHDCLVVKVLRSPHAHALIEEINTDIARKVPGIECIFTYKDVPQKRFTMAGQTFPEPSPYDRLILDQRVRFVGDAVAIVAGESEKAVDKALKLIKVKYQVLEPVLDFHTAKDNKVLVHPEDNWRSLCPVGADNQRNLCASDTCGDGDVDAVLADCDEVVEHTYHTKACQQAMMETFRTYTEMDRLRTAAHHFLDADCVPCAPYHRKCAGHSEEQDSRRKTAHRRRLRRKAVGRGRGISRAGDMENRQGGQDDLCPRGMSDCRFAAARNGSACACRCK